jgi:hypothetical protein
VQAAVGGVEVVGEGGELFVQRGGVDAQFGFAPGPGDGVGVGGGDAGFEGGAVVECTMRASSLTSTGLSRCSPKLSSMRAARSSGCSLFVRLLEPLGEVGANLAVQFGEDAGRQVVLVGGVFGQLAGGDAGEGLLGARRRRAGPAASSRDTRISYIRRESCSISMASSVGGFS